MDSSSDQAHAGIALLGAGAVGTALARRLAQRGYAVEAVLSRSAGSAHALAADVGARVASADLSDLPAGTRLLFCCVPDDALPALAARLARLDHDWIGTLVAHTAGARTSDVLAPLAAAGALTLSFHPLQTFPPGAGPDAFDGIAVALEGGPEAVRRGEALATALGTRPVVLTPEAKAHLHLAATIASNFTVAVVAMAGEVLAAAGVDRAEGATLLRPLLEGTWHNLRHQIPEEALTGPVARGDAQTLRRHVDLLTRRLPHLLPVYAALSTEAVRVAVRGGRLSQPDAQLLLDLLHAAVEPQTDPLY